MRKIDLSKSNGTMKKHLEKAMMHQHYRSVMIKSFNENFNVLEKAGEAAMRKSFLITGRKCKHLTAEEYANLAIQTWKEVIKNKTI